MIFIWKDEKLKGVYHDDDWDYDKKKLKPNTTNLLNDFMNYVFGDDKK